MSNQIRHEPESTRFVTSTDGGDAVLNYIENGDVVDFKSTLVPTEARNEGIGGKLVEAALEWAKSSGKKVIPTCPFVADYIQENDQYQTLLANPPEPVSDREKRPIGTQVMLGDD